MKRYGNPYPKMCSMENIRSAHINARKGKAHYHEVKMVNTNEELYRSQIQDMILNKTFCNSKYTTFLKLDNTKEERGCKYYFRHCDDVVILHSSREHLTDLRLKVSEYLEKNLKLQLKSNWQVFPVDVWGIDFLGYRFYHTHTTLRKSIATRFKRTISKIRSSNPETTGMINSIMSYNGWMKYADCHNLKTCLIDEQIHSIADMIFCESHTNNPLGGGYH